MMSGLKGYYFNNNTLLDPSVLVRTDPKIEFTWAGTDKPAPGVNNAFSARWKGVLIPPVSGDYTFYTSSDDGVRLFVNNQLLIENWTAHGATKDKSDHPITLRKGRKYPIILEYYNQGGPGEIKLSWSYPGKEEEIIPTQALLPTKNYKVTVVTGDKENAATDANVYLTIDGTLGVSAENHLTGSFPLGSTRYFDIEYTDLGNLESVHVRHDNQNDAPAWFLEKVIVKDEETGQEWVFLCGKWIANNEAVDPEKKLGRTLYPEPSTQPQEQGLQTGRIIGLKADNGLYLARIDAVKQAVIAKVAATNFNSDPTTHFEVVKLDGNKIALKANNGLFVAYKQEQTAEPPYRSAVASLSTASEAAQFEVVILDGGKIAITGSKIALKSIINSQYLARTQRTDNYNDVVVARIREDQYASEPKAQFELTFIK
ncbi:MULTISPECIES: PA14 domain-containing protein [unclassified Microcoleus]|uniref:PA14 domain-containing protein n=1 Tax=unclassified Microcoleus TaxID=2642155 RepID=UPI002FD23893